jgi:hypothetical protein
MGSGASGVSLYLPLVTTAGGTTYAVTLSSDGTYTMQHAVNIDWKTVAQGSWDPGATTRLAFQVSDATVRGSVNGTVVATVPDANTVPSDNAYVQLGVSGSSGAYADFANFQITQQ